MLFSAGFPASFRASFPASLFCLPFPFFLPACQQHPVEIRFEPHESSTQDRFFEKHGSSLKGFEQGASSNPMIVLYTKLDSWVGRYILSKQDDNSVVFESLLGVAEHWVKEFCSIVPRATPGDFKEVSDCGSQVKKFVHDSEGLVQIADKKVRPKSKAKAQAKQEEMNLSLYELNSKGEVTSALGRLLTAGFALGATVSLGDAQVWVVSGVSDNNVVLQNANPKASSTDDTLSIGASGFLKRAKLVQAKDCVVQHPSWPKGRTSKTPGVVESFVRARVWSALETLVCTLGGGVEDQVELHVKPRKLVRTKVSIPQGQLLLIPEATSIKVLDAKSLAASEPAPSGLWEVVVLDTPEKFASRVFLASGASDSVAPFWQVETAAVNEEPNMEVLWYKVSSLSGADPVESLPSAVPASGSPAEEEKAVASSTAKARSKAPGVKPKMPSGSPATEASGSQQASRKRLAAVLASGSLEVAFDRCVYMPVLVNCVALSAGCNLKMQAATAKAPPKVSLPKPISVLQVAKKAKI